MPNFQQKPLVVEAAQLPWTGPSADTPELRMLLGNARYTVNGNYIMLRTAEGILRVCPGDWIIRGVQGKLYPCKPDIFAASYEAAEAAA